MSAEPVAFPRQGGAAHRPGDATRATAQSADAPLAGLGEREALLRLIAHIEEGPRGRGPPGWFRWKRELARANGALEWLEQREEGVRALTWGPGGTVRTLALGFGVMTVAGQATARHGFSVSSLALSLAFMEGLALVFGIFTARAQWREAEARLPALIARGRALPDPQPGRRPGRPESADAGCRQED